MVAAVVAQAQQQQALAATEAIPVAVEEAAAQVTELTLAQAVTAAMAMFA